MAMYDFFSVVMMMKMRTGSLEAIESDRSWNF